jgi:hypothetical protein
LDGELNKTKGVGLDDIYNFPTETFFIWICLGPQNIYFKSSKMNTTYLPLNHNWLCSGVISRGTSDACGREKSCDLQFGRATCVAPWCGAFSDEKFGRAICDFWKNNF